MFKTITNTQNILDLKQNFIDFSKGQNIPKAYGGKSDSSGMHATLAKFVGWRSGFDVED